MRSGFKMKGYSYPGKSPVKQKVDPDAPGTPGTPGYEPEVKSTDYLTKTPVGPRAKKKTNDKGTLELFLEKRGDNKGALTETQMQNTGDFNISEIHTDTKMSLDKKKKKLAANKASNKKRSDAERALEAKEDAMGL